ncbi:hypothetical protein McPS_03840 [Marichromatium sp. PS1]|uniref:hypothetical protein n=1 Tax=Marichromatium sp. PS1 TaxID=3138932 RepID=UPI0032E6B8EA
MSAATMLADPGEAEAAPVASRQLANLVGGCWRIPWSGAAFRVGPVRVARSSGLDVTAAIAAAGVAAQVWQVRGSAARAVRLDQVGGLIDRRRFEQGIAGCRSDCEQAAAVWCEPSRLVRAAWRQALESDLRGEPRGGVAIDARGVRWLAVSVSADPLPELARALRILQRGETLVVALLFDDRRPQGVAVAALWCALARCLPPGVLNVLCGLGLELGVALVEADRRARCPVARQRAPLARRPGAAPPSLAALS